MIDRMPDHCVLVSLLQLAVEGRAPSALENIALRHQLAASKRSVKRPNIKDRDRIFWLTIMRMLGEGREALVFVQLAVVIKLHREGFKLYWQMKFRAKLGRPPIQGKGHHADQAYVPGACTLGSSVN